MKSWDLIWWSLTRTFSLRCCRGIQTPSMKRETWGERRTAIDDCYNDFRTTERRSHLFQTEREFSQNSRFNLESSYIGSVIDCLWGSFKYLSTIEDERQVNRGIWHPDRRDSKFEWRTTDDAWWTLQHYQGSKSSEVVILWNCQLLVILRVFRTYQGNSVSCNFLLENARALIVKSFVVLELWFETQSQSIYSCKRQS